MADEKKEENVEKEAPKDVEEAPKEEKTKERTKKEFKKLKKSNKDLKEKVVEYENVLDSLKPKQPQPQPQGMGPGMTTYSEPRKDVTDKVPTADQFKALKQDTIDDVFAGMMDKEGYLDGRKLMDTLKEMDQRAKRAEERAARAENAAQETYKTQRDFEETTVVRRVHKKYPQLNPKNDKFDQDYFDAVRNELIGQIVNGRKEDLEAAAEKWYGKMYKEEEVATKKEKEDAKEQIASAQPRSSIMSGYYDNYEEKQLRKDIQHGKKGALAEVLRRHEQKS